MLLVTSLTLCFAALPQQSLSSLISKVDDEKAIEVSVLVEKLDGEVLFDYRSKRNLTLASNTKLFTTSAALLELGADFRWHTRALRYKNDLAIVGDGDPSLYRTASGVDAAQELVVELLQSLRAVQVSKIETLYSGSSIFGHSFDIGSPYTIVHTGNANASGSAVVNFTIPMAVASNTIAYVEGGAQNGAGVDDSNLLTLLIQ